MLTPKNDREFAQTLVSPCAQRQVRLPVLEHEPEQRSITGCTTNLYCKTSTAPPGLELLIGVPFFSFTENGDERAVAKQKPRLYS